MEMRTLAEVRLLLGPDFATASEEELLKIRDEVYAVARVLVGAAIADCRRARDEQLVTTEGR